MPVFLRGGNANFTSIAIDDSGTPYVVYRDLGNSDKATVMKYNGSWTLVGTAGFSTGTADDLSIAIDGSGTPYVVYVNSDDDSHKATVRKYNGNSWEYVGSSGFSAGTTVYNSIAIDDSGTPYTVYQDWGNSGKATVMKYNGSSWELVGTAGFSAGQADYTSIAIDGNGTPYVVYRDYGNSGKATVMKYNGSSWELVGIAGFSAGSSIYTCIVMDGNNTPYVVYKDWGNSQKATVMKYNGSSWESVGIEGFSAGDADFTSIAIDGSGIPYVVYRDDSNSDKTTVMRYNGNSWELVGTAGFSAGVANYTSIALDNSGIPYVVYTDYGNSSKATVMKYNGSSWINVGTAGFSASTAYFTSITLDDSGTPYVAYREWTNGNYDRATVMKYNGNNWENVGPASFTASTANFTCITTNGSGTLYMVFSSGGAFGYKYTDAPIYTGIVSPLTYCAGATVNVPFSVSSTFISGNVFTAQLSNASGSFASPVIIGTVSSITDSTINATIPGGAITGTGYRIRVVSSSPAEIGTDNGTDLSITASPTITSFTPATGPVGTLVTITGADLNSPSSFTIGGVSAIAVSNDGSTLVGMVMPSAVTGTAWVTTGCGTATGAGAFTVTSTPHPGLQQGAKLVGTGATGPAYQGRSVSLSADGNTAIVGGFGDNNFVGGAWVYTRSGEIWTQQGAKLVGTGASGAARQGYSVSLSADGNTAMVGGYGDNNYAGAVWVYTRTDGVWTQQGSKLVGTAATGNAGQGHSVSLSADGNTAIVGGYRDNSYAGAAWVFTRTNGIWAQQGAKLVGTSAVGAAWQGLSASISADGTTAIVGGFYDNSQVGAAWVYTRTGGVWSQQGAKLVGTGASGASRQGQSVSLSADGNTAMVGGYGDDSWTGAVWVYTRVGGIWTQQGNKLVGAGAIGAAEQGTSVSLSADGNSAIIGGAKGDSEAGAAWVFVRTSGVWTQQGSKLVGAGATGNSRQGVSVSLSADGTTSILGGHVDNSYAGAAWVFVPCPEIIVLGNNQSIVDGDTIPDVLDDTDFGDVSVGLSSPHTFTIVNNGSSDLFINDISITSADSAVFSITVNASSPVASGDSTSFQITCAPATIGVHTATVVITSSDCDNAVFEFVISGKGIPFPCTSPSGESVSEIQYNRVTMHWNSVYSALEYRIRFREVGSGSWQYITIGAPDTFKVKAGLVQLTDYEWQVKTVCDGEQSGYGTLQTFTTLEMPCDPPTTYSTTGILDDRATMNWSEVSTALEYKIRFREVGAGSWTYITETDISRTKAGLTPGTDYQWQVKVVCDGVQSSYGPLQSFTTYLVSPCPLPDSYSTTLIQGDRATLGWSAVGAASAYRIKFREVGTTAWTNINVNSSTTSKIKTGLTPLTDYEWQLQSRCGAIRTSFGPLQTFTTGPDCPKPVGFFSDNIQDDRATMNWSQVTEAVEYKVKIRPVGGSWSYITVDLPDTYKTKAGLSLGTQYQWRARTVCASSQSPYAAVQLFTTTGVPAKRDGTQFEEDDEENGISVYPNPTNGELTIDLGADYENASVVIRNTLGQVVHSVQVKDANQLTVNILGARGLYTVEVLTEAGVSEIIRVMKN